jgi:transcriptional regulator with XRE-family HTH domain
VLECPETNGKRWYDRKPDLWQRVERTRLHMGHVLFARRRALKLSQQDVADRADVDRRTVADFERGIGRVPMVTVFRLMDAVEVDASITLVPRRDACGTCTPFAAGLE